MKLFFWILLSYLQISSLAQANPADELCHTQDMPCAPRTESENDKAFCERINKAKTAGNAGYANSYCRFDRYDRLAGFSTRYIPKKERDDMEVAGPLSFSGAMTIEGAFSPGMQAALNETNMGRPIAETMGGVVKLGILGTRDKLKLVNVDLEECLPEGTLIIPKDANSGWVALETLNHAITSVGLLSHEISRTGRIEIIQREITRSQITVPLRVQKPVERANEAIKVEGREKPALTQVKFNTVADVEGEVAAGYKNLADKIGNVTFEGLDGKSIQKKIFMRLDTATNGEKFLRFFIRAKSVDEAKVIFSNISLGARQHAEEPWIKSLFEKPLTVSDLRADGSAILKNSSYLKANVEFRSNNNKFYFDRGKTPLEDGQYIIQIVPLNEGSPVTFLAVFKAMALNFGLKTEQ